MAPFDVPHVTHDMILRFMGVNFSAVTDGSAKIPSSVGLDTKPLFVEGSKPVPSGVPGAETSPQRDQAMWEGQYLRFWHLAPLANFNALSQAYYNAGSAALILVLVLLALGTLFWCRMRRRKVRLSNIAATEEESIPLNTAMSVHDRNGNEEDDENFRQRKGKDRVETPKASEPPIFDVGDDEDEDGYKSDTRR
jgi:carboxypeptidase D